MAKTMDQKAAESTKRRGNRTDNTHNYGVGYWNNNSGRNTRNSRKNKPTGPASAPYNFIKLPEYVIPAEFVLPRSGIDDVVQTAYKEHVQKINNHSGYIDIKITTETPLFIGGNVTEKGGEKYQAFYGSNDNPIIPGSSIKGMVKNIFKIVTASGFKPYSNGVGDFENRRLYYRALGGSKSLCKEYKAEMISSEYVDGKPQSKTKAKSGFLIKTRDEYFIVPTTHTDDNKYSDHPELDAKSNGPSIDGWESNSLNIHTGSMNNKRTFAIIRKPIKFDTTRKISIDKNVISMYREDKNREGFDILEDGLKEEKAREYTGCNDITYVCPCFYKTDGNNVVLHFGYGRFYRIPYDLEIKDHLPKSIKDQEKTVDLCDSIFGLSECWAGRLSFQDLHVFSTFKKCSPSLSQPLMSPKPTSFQLYLNQDMSSYTENHKHWNDNTASIRGYKLYWHQPKSKAQAWQKKDGKKAVTGMKYIEPIDSGVTFNGRIYFNRLSDVELGALLLVLNLNEYADADKTIFYKLGMGKSIGLGSVSIDTTLTVLNTIDRYMNLFDEQTWAVGKKDNSKESYIRSFMEYRYNMLGSTHSINYNEMMKDLFSMMDWNIANGSNAIKKWSEAISIMTISKETMDPRMKHRTKLDTPRDFIKKWSK